MKKVWITIGIVAGLIILAAGFVSYACEDDWCYVFPWQKPTRIQPPPSGNDVPYEDTLEGEYSCLPHKNTSGPQTLECALGIETNDGSYALDMSGLLFTGSDIKVPTGTKIRVTGTVALIQAISSDQWQKYDIKGIMKVKTFSVL